MWRTLLIMVLVSKRISTSSPAIENWPWSDMKDASVETVVEGQNIDLKCAGRITDAPAHWDYKPCGTAANMTLCSEIIDDDSIGQWRPLTINSSILTLKAVPRQQGGLYRCRQAATPFINIYYTTHLEVLSYSDWELPQFLDGLPKNVTVHRDTQAVFHCKVASKSPVSIMWVWQGAAPGAFKHMDEWYTPMGRGTVKLVGGASLAKLVLPRPRVRHAGKYFCIAVNTKGYSVRSAYLEVISNEETKWEENHYFFSFFLLPVGLAIVPVSIWLYFTWNRRRRLKSLECDDEDGQNVEMSLKFADRENAVFQC